MVLLFALYPLFKFPKKFAQLFVLQFVPNQDFRTFC